MALVTLKELLHRADMQNTAVGAFSVGNMEMVLGAVKAAEKLNTPIIIQIAEVRLPTSPLEVIGPLMVAAAENSSVDICVHLDHGLNYKTVEKALEIGFTSVMLDASLLPLEDNIALTQRVVKKAKEYGASVEAELGVVGGNEGGGKGHAIQCTDPEIANEFCNKTGIDALAVAIGNAHGHYTVTPELRFDILEKIHQSCTTPLVLHGGSGITPEAFQECIRNGIRKVNIATAGFDAVVNSSKLALNGDNVNYFSLSAAVADGVCENTEKHIRIFNMENLK
ncbi:MAG: ketose-bisphosphate aldolase [Clostridia bacterium]|nr:ketose-bisphosphate aldolase [Clostridia bacterium]